MNLAEENQAPPRRGRKPVRESRSREITERVAKWKLTPKAQREPPTLRELARDSGIRESLASYYARRIPDSVDDLLARRPAVALLQCPGIRDMALHALEKGFKGRGGGRLA